MNRFTSIRFSAVARCTLALALVIAPLLIAPQSVQAATWHATAGAQSNDMGRQALAFLVNELWIHAGDSITWTFPTPEIHTVTFLKQDTTPQQIRPARPGAGGGCPGTTADGSDFNGSTCVTSPELVNGQTYTVRFPTAGNFKLVCLIHPSMTGTVHVLPTSENLPFDQAFYDRQASGEQADLLSDGARLEGLGTATARRTSEDEVTAGIGAIVANGGGAQIVSVVRFLPETIVVRVGDSVEWTNLDPETPHTVTFGAEPANPVPPSAGVGTDSDGAEHAILGSPGGNLHSGFLVAAPQERRGLAQSPLAVNRFRVTFTSPGTFDYFCALHDELGMAARVIVHK
jgi:plastocyanin